METTRTLTTSSRILMLAGLFVPLPIAWYFLSQFRSLAGPSAMTLTDFNIVTGMFSVLIVFTYIYGNYHLYYGLTGKRRSTSNEAPDLIKTFIATALLLLTLLTLPYMGLLILYTSLPMELTSLTFMILFLFSTTSFLVDAWRPFFRKKKKPEPQE